MEGPSIYSEKQLLVAVANGNEEAFRQLYDIYHQRIFSFASFLTRSESLAEEITQDIFIKIWSRRTELSVLNEFGAWLRVVVRNHTYSFMRRMALEQLALKEMGRQASDKDKKITQNDVDYKEVMKLLEEAIRQLPFQQRRVYLLHRQEGKKYQEIANELGLSTGTVKTHMKVALRNIRLYVGGRLDLWIGVAMVLFLAE